VLFKYRRELGRYNGIMTIRNFAIALRAGLILLTFPSTSCSRAVNHVHAEVTEQPGADKDNSTHSDSVELDTAKKQRLRNATQVSSPIENDEASTENADGRSDTSTSKEAIEGSVYPNGEPDNSRTTDDDNVCKGYIKRVEKSGFSIRVTMCNDKTKKFTFKHPVADVKPNPRFPYVAVYTSSMHDQLPDTEDDLIPDELFIVNIRNDKKYRYGRFSAIEYHYDLWSRDGDFAAFLGRGIQIVKTTELDNYLRNFNLGKFIKAYRVAITDKDRSPDDPGEVMEVAGWRSNTVLIIHNGCCGDLWETEFDVETNIYRRVECAYGYCMRISYNHFEAHQKDIVIKDGIVTKYQVATELKRYFNSIDKHCSSSINWKSMPDLSGEFALTFKLNKEGKAVEPAIRVFKTSIPLSGEVTFRNCLIEFTKEIFFPASEISGRESVGVYIVMYSDVNKVNL
jgi:hypothetical protein